MSKCLNDGGRPCRNAGHRNDVISFVSSSEARQYRVECRFDGCLSHRHNDPVKQRINMARHGYHHAESGIVVARHIFEAKFTHGETSEDRAKAG